MPTRRRHNPAPLVDALEGAHTKLAEAARLSAEVAENLGKVAAAISREKRDAVAYAALYDAEDIQDVAKRAGEFARDGAAAAKKAKRLLIEAYELWE